MPSSNSFRGASTLLAILGITSLVVAGCAREAGPEPGETAPVAQPTPTKAADTVPPRGTPVSAQMRRTLHRLAELMPAEDFERIEGKQQQWLAGREQHCAASANLATNDDEAKRVMIECRRDSDAQVMPRLRARHFELLRAEPVPQSSPETIDTDIDSSKAPTVVQAIQVVEHMGQLVIAGGRKVVGLDATSGEKNWSVDANERSNSRVAVSPNGKILATGSRDDSLLRFWDAETGDFLSEVGVEKRDAPFAFLGDGRHMVIGSRRLVVLDLVSGRQRQVTMGASNASTIATGEKFVAVGSQGSHIETYTIEQEQGGIELDFVERVMATMPSSPVVALGLSSDGLHLTSVTRSGVIGRWTMPELARVSGTHGELRYIGDTAMTDKQDVLFLAGNTGDRGAKGRIIAVDVDAGLTKRLYEDARTNSPGIALAEKSNTLFIGDSTILTSIRVATDIEGFDNMESLADGALANVKSAEEALEELRGRGGTRPKSSLGELSDDTKVHVVGVYEGELPDGKKSGFREHPTGKVVVNVGGTGRAVLVLTAYEPVEWTVLPRGVFVDHILLFGYHDQQVNAPSGARVYTNLQSSAGSSSMYAYKKDGNYAKLERAVREITGKDVDTFQGTYRAGSFSVNSSDLPRDATQAPGINKWVDEDGVVHYGDPHTAGQQ